jgi:SAM-dependent methyltransferase
VTKDTKIADFGCGPGLYTTRLARKQAKVTGIDFSKRSIQYAGEHAEKSGLSIRYVNENYLDFETEQRFDLILMITCDFCALSPQQRKQMLEKFHRLLKPSGHVLLDVYLPAAFDGREEIATYELSLSDGFWSPNRYYEFVNSFNYEDEKVVLDKFTIVEADRVRAIYNWLQYFEPDDVKKEFAASGFTVNEIYADVAGSEFDAQASEFAVVAGKA